MIRRSCGHACLIGPIPPCGPNVQFTPESASLAKAYLVRYETLLHMKRPVTLE